MTTWPRTAVLDRLGIDVPIVQAPMAGAQGPELAIAVASAGGLGSLPCAMLPADRIVDHVGEFRAHTSAPLNLNFFCHEPADPDAARVADQAWRRRLSPYATELGLDPSLDGPSADRRPFDEAACALVEDLRPEIVSFHFGLPAPALLARVRAAGATVLSSATTVDEARWLAANGCDVVIAQGVEAGGHRGMFLQSDLADVSTQIGTMALVPQIAAAVDVPVIAAGGIASGAGIAAALSLGAAAVQIGTAFLLAPEATISVLHRDALRSPAAAHTALTNVFTGRPARGIVNRLMRELGPIARETPPFPVAAGAVSQLRAAAEQQGSTDFTPLWSGQAASLAVEMPAAELVRGLVDDALALS